MGQNITEHVGFVPNFSFIERKFPVTIVFVEQEFNTTSKLYDRNFSIRSTKIGSDNKFENTTEGNIDLAKRLKRQIVDLATHMNLIGFTKFQYSREVWLFRDSYRIIYCQHYEVSIHLQLIFTFILNSIYFQCHMNETKTLIDCSGTDNETVSETTTLSGLPSEILSSVVSDLPSTIPSAIPSMLPTVTTSANPDVTLNYLIIGILILVIVVLTVVIIILVIKFNYQKNWKAVPLSDSTTFSTTEHSTVKTISSKGADTQSKDTNIPKETTNAKN